MTSVSHQGFLGWGGGLGGGGMYFAHGCVIWNKGAREKTDHKMGGWHPKNCSGKKKLKSP